jgi:hypothetical protein
MRSGKRGSDEEIFVDPSSDQKQNLQVVRTSQPKNSPELGKLQLKDILNSDKKEDIKDCNKSNENSANKNNDNSASLNKSNFGWNGGLSTALKEINELKKQLEQEKLNNARIKKEFEQKALVEKS